MSLFSSSAERLTLDTAIGFLVHQPKLGYDSCHPRRAQLKLLGLSVLVLYLIELSSHAE